MKKLVLIGAVMIVGLSSCSKTYSCDCTIDGKLKEGEAVTYKTSEDVDDAENICSLADAFSKIGNDDNKCDWTSR